MTKKGELRREVTIAFDAPTFLEVSSPILPSLKVASLSVTIEIAVRVERGLGLSNFVEFVLKSLSDGTVRRFKRPRMQAPTK